jgi:hypothetical protein
MKNLLALSAVALLVAGPALADSAFSLDRVQDQGNLVELSNVRAEAPAPSRSTTSAAARSAASWAPLP